MPPEHGKPRAIIHVDMDAFYASVEIMDRPELAGKPVVVGGTAEERGVVAAASYEARKFGVHSAMSAYRARKLCPNGIFIAPRMARYAEVSDRIRAILESYTPIVEPISIDEAFLDVTGSERLFGTGREIGRAVKNRIRDEIGLVASVGVAPNKFLAKLASDLEKPDGFVVITREEAETRLAPMPVARLWGVGKVTERALAKLGIRTIADVARAPDSTLESVAGAYAGRLKLLARGIDERPVVPDAEAKSIGAENTFPRDMGEPDELRRELDVLSDRVAQRARSEGMAGYTVHLKARYPDFTTVTRAVTLSAPTAETVVIRDAARELLETRLDRGGRPLRLLGVSISNLVRMEEPPASLLDDARSARNRTLDGVIDALQSRFGSLAIRRGGGRGRR